MTSPGLEQEILDRLQIAPRSIEELAGETYSDFGQVARSLSSLLSAGAIVRLQCDREGGPFYCLPGYVEPEGNRDHEDLRQGRDYARHYERQDGELD